MPYMEITIDISSSYGFAGLQGVPVCIPRLQPLMGDGVRPQGIAPGLAGMHGWEDHLQL